MANPVRVIELTLARPNSDSLIVTIDKNQETVKLDWDGQVLNLDPLLSRDLAYFLWSNL